MRGSKMYVIEHTTSVPKTPCLRHRGITFTTLTLSEVGRRIHVRITETHLPDLLNRILLTWNGVSVTRRDLRGTVYEPPSGMEPRVFVVTVPGDLSCPTQTSVDLFGSESSHRDLPEPLYRGPRLVSDRYWEDEVTPWERRLNGRRGPGTDTVLGCLTTSEEMIEGIVRSRREEDGCNGSPFKQINGRDVRVEDI